MEQMRKNEIFRKAFFATVIVNGCIALADLAAGFFFLFKQQITAFLYLSINPVLHSFLALVTSISSRNQSMGVFYFFSHGLVKLVLVWGLLTNRMWAYPFAIVLLTGFTLYQIYDIIFHFSFFTGFLLLVNGITIFFISREYKQIVVQ